MLLPKETAEPALAFSGGACIMNIRVRPAHPTLTITGDEYPMYDKLARVSRAFRIQGEYLGYEEIKIGNVNRTYRVDFRTESGESKSYILQAVNTYVFKDPVKVMENIDRVTEYIRRKQPEKLALHYHHTAERHTYLFDGDDFWRLYNFIPSSTYNECHDLGVVRNAGVAFGEFQMLLSDFDAAMLHVTIPAFHDTRVRYATLERHAAEDPCGRVAEVEEELRWLLSVKDTACRLTDLHNEGKLPLRVTHNDTKINNVLFEKGGSRPLVVVDLDTVMPGLVGHDFGDAIRFAANRVAEDCPEAERAGVDMEIFRAFSEGFLMKTAATLTETELDTLALSCFALACELATRFLDDYILGDPYFKINYPAHNLVRTRCQVALAKDMLQKLDEMERIVRECAAECR